MIRVPAPHPAGHGRAAPLGAGPAQRYRRPTLVRLAALCAAACLLPPLVASVVLLEEALPLRAAVFGTLAVLSVPTYVVFYLAAAALLRRQDNEDDRHEAWVALKWDLAGGAVLLNLSFIEYFALGAGLFAEPVQLAVIALTDIVAFMVGAGLVEFLRGLLVRRRR